MLRPAPWMLIAALGALAALFVPPAQARFVSVDPVQVDANHARNFNRYNYAADNPYRFVDPDGRQSRDILQIHKESERFGPPRLCCTSMTQEQAGVVVDFLPGFGDAKGIAETFAEPSVANVVGATVGLVPVVGDVGKRLIKSADDLIESAAPLQRLKGGTRQGHVKGDATAILDTITQGGEATANRGVRMPDGSFIFSHTSKSTGNATIDINKGGQTYKIRVEAEE